MNRSFKVKIVQKETVGGPGPPKKQKFQNRAKGIFNVLMACMKCNFKKNYKKMISVHSVKSKFAKISKLGGPGPPTDVTISKLLK